MQSKEPEGERVRKTTSESSNQSIDNLIINNIEKYSQSHQLISQRIKDLDKKWDIERLLEVNMSTLAITGITLAYFVHINWLILPAVVLLFFVQHAVQGWCPPLPIFRHFKVRTRPEIDREKYALKALRGDFNNIEFTSSDRGYQAFKATERL